MYRDGARRVILFMAHFIQSGLMYKNGLSDAFLYMNL